MSPFRHSQGPTRHGGGQAALTESTTAHGRLADCEGRAVTGAWAAPPRGARVRACACVRVRTRVVSQQTVLQRLSVGDVGVGAEGGRKGLFPEGQDLALLLE